MVPGHVVDDGAPLADQAVEEGRLADVRPADDGDNRVGHRGLFPLRRRSGRVGRGAGAGGSRIVTVMRGRIRLVEAKAGRNLRLQRYHVLAGRAAVKVKHHSEVSPREILQRWCRAGDRDFNRRDRIGELQPRSKASHGRRDRRGSGWSGLASLAGSD